MAGVTYRRPKAGWQPIALSPAVGAACLAEAERGVQIARGLSASFVRTGDYERSFHAQPNEVEVAGMRRLGAKVVNDSDHAAAVEWGYHGRRDEPSSSAHRVLGRTAAMLGGHE